MSVQRGAEITVTPEKAVAGGWMLARHEGQVVLVSGAIPGERVRARVNRVNRRVAEATVIELVERSIDRRSDESQACGGTVYAHIAYRRQLSLKAELVADAFARIAKIALDGPVPVMPSREAGYRMRARLHIRHGRLGFFREGTHELCDAASTGQLLGETVEALNGFQAALASSHVSSGACELAENVPADERAVVVETDAPIGGALPSIPGISGLARISHAAPELVCDYGSPFVVDRLSVASTSIVLTHHVRSFFQGNRWLLCDLAARVVGQIADDNPVDLYAGVGLFAVSLAAAGRRGIVAVEGDRSGAADLATNARPYGEAIGVKYASVEDYLSVRTDTFTGTVLLDPPRTGASTQTLSGVIRLKPARIVYVSCDVATLARDVRTCVDAGYRLEHIEAFDMFPNTAHVELLAVLVRDATFRRRA
jgi:23S rRNA (uracil1939-C5)-methyltransferase